MQHALAELRPEPVEGLIEAKAATASTRLVDARLANSPTEPNQGIPAYSR